jgi:uncharacterized repeat protein (TIGR01451 family)
MPRCRDGASSAGALRRSARAIGVLLCAASATAQTQQVAQRSADVLVSSTLERIVAAPSEGDGAEVRITTDTIASHADQLIMSVRFTNRSDSAVDTVRITSPIPADVKYVPGSASGPGSEVLFSADNGRSFGSPAELKLASPEGGTRVADPADYTHVRWVLSSPLAAGATGIARFRAVPR